MRPYQINRHTIALKLDCEKHLCGRCRWHKLMADRCLLFRSDLGCTKKGLYRRLPECKAAEIASRPDGHSTKGKP